MSRFLLLYLGIIIIMIFNVNSQRHMYIPCRTCFVDRAIKKTYDDSEEFCEDCISNYYNFDAEYAHDYLQSCIDYYEYVCRPWDAISSIFQMKWSTIDFNRYRSHIYIKNSLEKETEYDNLPPVKLAKQYYRTCVDEVALEMTGLIPMHVILNVTGEWPILMSEEKWKAKKPSWQDTDNNYFRVYIFSILFNISYIIDDGNPILMVHPSLTLPLGDKVKIDIQHGPLDMYMITIMKVVRAFAKNKEIRISEEQLRMDVADLVAFEISLKNIIGYKKRNPVAGDKMTIAELQKYYDLAQTQRATSKINWLDKIKTAANFFDVTIDASETIIVYDKEILHKLAYLLDNTPQHVIVNYLQWHVVSTFMSTLNKEMRDIELEHYYFNDIKSYNNIIHERRWLKCIKEFQIKDIFSYMFKKTKYISKDILNDISNIFNDIKEEMMDYIQSLKWLNKLTKTYMIQKIYNTSMSIGYSDWYDHEMIPSLMNRTLETYNYYFLNVLATIMYRNAIKQESILFKPEVESSYRFDFLFDNPYYDQQNNVIYIPVAAMIFPYFQPKTIAANYGGIGSIFGQQLAHSLNLHIGSYLDKYGNLKLNTRIRKAYEKRTQCILTSLEEYHIFMMNITNQNPEYIQKRENMRKIMHGTYHLHYTALYENIIKNESIAHFIGTQIAYAALQKKMNSRSKSKLLRDDHKIKDFSTPEELNMSPEQLFFSHNTLLTCGTKNPYDEDFLHINSARDVITGNLANIEAFSEAFNCPPDSPMNPTLRCKNWKEETSEDF